MVKVVSYTKNNGFFIAPIGSYPAIIVWIAELGTAMSEFGKDDTIQDLVRIFYEIESEVNTSEEWKEIKIEEKVFLVEQNYTCTIWNKSNLWKMISWVYWKQPKEIKNFSLDALLWKKCVINIKHNDNWYAKVESVSLESNKMIYHKQEQEIFYFWLSKDEYNSDLFDNFAPFIQRRIERSTEYMELFWVKEIDSLKEAEKVFDEEDEFLPDTIEKKEFN